jgi:hypothetical protein
MLGAVRGVCARATSSQPTMTPAEAPPLEKLSPPRLAWAPLARAVATAASLGNRW